MSECQHPRSQEYTDDRGRSRCGACGDVWVDEVWPRGDGTFYGDFVSLIDDGPALPLAAHEARAKRCQQPPTALGEPSA